MHHEGDRGGARTPYPGTPDDGSGDSHERRSDQIADQIDGCLVHQIEKEIVEVVQTLPKQRTQQFIAEQIVDFPVPHVRVRGNC